MSHIFSMRYPCAITIVAVRLTALSLRCIGVDVAMFRTKLHVKVRDHQGDLGITRFSHACRLSACISITAAALPCGSILWLVACDGRIGVSMRAGCGVSLVISC